MAISNALVIFGTAGDDLINGGDGNDTLSGGEGSDKLFGGAGDDILSANQLMSFDNGTAVDELYGGGGNDFLFSGYGDIVDGGDGFDTVAVSYLGASAGITGDTAQLHQGLPLVAGAGTFKNIERFSDIALTPYNDKMVIGDQQEPAIVRAWDGDDHLVGQSVSVTMYGGNGNDLLVGSTSDDVLYGENGNDRLIGYLGIDTLWGGEGIDRFIFTSIADSTADYFAYDHDFIADWEVIDRIDLSAIDADPLTPGDQAFTLSEVAFGFPAGPQPAGSVVIGGFGGQLYVSVFVSGGLEPDMIIDLWSSGGEAALTGANLIL